VKRLRLLLVEDHELMGQGLQALLEPDHSVVGIVRDGTQVLPSVREYQPDLVLLDLDLQEHSGNEVLAGLARAHPALPVVVVTRRADPVVTEHAFRLGARAFVSKDRAADELRRAIREAMKRRRK
jgi:DNA-binding NarL/FixJ family response regulator